MKAQARPRLPTVMVLVLVLVSVLVLALLTLRPVCPTSILATLQLHMLAK